VGSAKQSEWLASCSPIEMSGQTVAGCHVIRRAQNRIPHIGAIWLCRCGCGAEFEIAGYQLRAYERKGSTYRCKACRRPHPGSVPQPRKEPDIRVAERCVGYFGAAVRAATRRGDAPEDIAYALLWLAVGIGVDCDFADLLPRVTEKLVEESSG